MPSNLTASKINVTYSQLLHLDGGPSAAEKPIYSGTGVATALRLGLTSISIGNIRLAGNQITAINGVVELPTATIALANITGGSINGITDLAIADGGTGASSADAARTNLGLGTLATQAANNVAITGGSITGVTIPFSSISERKYGMFSDVQDQTGNISTATAVLFRTNEMTGAGVSVASNSQITFATAGTYMIAVSLQFNNSESSDYDATVWFAKNGANIDRSATVVTVAKLADGGKAFFNIVNYVTVTANQYIEILWLPEHAGVTLDYTAADAIVPAIPSAIVVAERIA